MGESEAESRVFGYVGIFLLVFLAIVGAVLLVAGGRAVADENRSAGVFPAQVLVAQKAPSYEVAFTGPEGVVRADVTTGNKHHYQVGNRMDVRYWPDQHRVERAGDGARFSVGAGAVLVLLGLGGAGYRLVRTRRNRTPA
ncbi:hypothetical protein [Amycolatopsis sp. CA-128772]|uniref:hypothetical protein n=1 Tax=Amycolatopsis sp. CA-128772 TaxID=2073159 RepID=UPI0011AFEA99|nr:hypothetical protein [Amycolatopsis sp. CA-128772]